MGSIGEKHISRLAMPKSWKVKRKGIKWVTKPLPGMHPLKSGIPLVVAFRDILGIAKTKKEVKNILQNQEILIDRKRRKQERFIIGLMDVISISKTKEHFRIILTKKGRLSLIPIKEEESKVKICKIKGKNMLKGKIQINLNDGRTILIEKGDFKVGDSVLIELPSQKIKQAIKLEKESLVYLTGGKHIGEIGVIEELKDNIIVYKRNNQKHETFKKYALVVGKNKPLISLEAKK